MTKHDIDVASRVLIYQEDGQYVAHALDCDLIGCGSSKSKSLDELRDNVLAQVTLAIHHDSPESFFRIAPEELIDRWHSARKQAIRQLAGLSDVPMTLKCVATFIQVSADEIRREARRNRFSTPAGDPALASA